MRKLILVTCLLIGCHTPAGAGQGAADDARRRQAVPSGAIRLRAAEYDARKAPPDERNYMRALFRAVECETLLPSTSTRSTGRARPSCRRTRACAPSSSSAGSRCFAASRAGTAFPRTTEEGAAGSAKLSKPAADREMEAAAQALWKDREKLARLPLKLRRFFVLTDAICSATRRCGTSRPAHAPWLAGLEGRVAPHAVRRRRFRARLRGGQTGLARSARSTKRAAHLSVAASIAQVAAERWRVERVMLGDDAGSGTKYERRRGTRRRIRAAARLGAAAAHPARPRRAAAKAAGLLYAGSASRRSLLIERRAARRRPESDVAVELRQLRHSILDKSSALSTPRHA